MAEVERVDPVDSWALHQDSRVPMHVPMGTALCIPQAASARRNAHSARISATRGIFANSVSPPPAPRKLALIVLWSSSIMKAISRAAVLMTMLTCGGALAETVPPPLLTPPAAQSVQAKRARRLESFKDWWLWSLVAVLSAGTIVTSVVIATVPRGSLNTNSPVGAGSMAVTARF
jgi:hypothetical protein